MHGGAMGGVSAPLGSAPIGVAPPGSASIAAARSAAPELLPVGGVGMDALATANHDARNNSLGSLHDKKKNAKREANRKSAQKCRQRKKERMQDIHAENLRLQEQQEILNALTDMVFSFVVTFDKRTGAAHRPPRSSFAGNNGEVLRKVGPDYRKSGGGGGGGAANGRGHGSNGVGNNDASYTPVQPARVWS